MPNREDETWLNIHPHLPTCNCVSCTQKRLLKARDEDYAKLGYPVTQCPTCGRKSLFYNGKAREYQCLNQECGATGETLMHIKKQVK